jgi:hypothetical protein
VRRCRLSVWTAAGIIRRIEVQAGSVFEAAAAPLAQLLADGLADPPILRVEMLLRSIAHDVPLTRLQR